MFYSSIGSATATHRRLNDAIVREGFAPLAASALVGGVGLWLTPENGCSLLQVEINVLGWEARRAADGRRVQFLAGDFMTYVGAPVITSGRTSVYPLLGFGPRVHFLNVAGAGGGSDDGPTTFATALRRNGKWDGPAQFVGDLAVGAHYLAGSPSKNRGLVIGARMGYIVGPTLNSDWIVGSDTIHGPRVNTSGPYGRLLVGVSFGRRDVAPPRRSPTPVEPRIRDGRPTRRIG